MDILHELVNVLKDAPEEFRREAVEALREVIEDYEDYVSVGEPEILEWKLQKMERSEFATESTHRLVATIRKVLRRGRS